MATGPKAGLYQNVQSASNLPPTLENIEISTQENMGVWAAVINHVFLRSDMSVRTKVVKVMKAFLLLLILVILYYLLKRHFNYLSNRNIIWKSVEPCGCFRPVDLSTNDQFINSTTCSRVSPIN